MEQLFSMISTIIITVVLSLINYFLDGSELNYISMLLVVIIYNQFLNRLEK